MTSHSLDTRAVHAGREDLVDLGVHAVPIDLSTTYPSRDSQAEAARLDVLGTGADDGGLPVYARVGNPTVARFEQALADLESADAGIAFASGMAALSACLHAPVTAGRPHVVAVRPLYGTNDHLLDSGLLGTSVTWATADGVADAVTDRTGLVVVETPATPLSTRSTSPRSPRRFPTCRSWWTTRSPPRCCNVRCSWVRPTCCTARPSTSVGTVM